MPQPAVKKIPSPGISTTLFYYGEYVALRLLQWLLGVIPRPLGLRLGATAGAVLYRLGIYRRIVRVNMEHVGIWNAAEADRITRSLYRNIGKYTVDFLRPATPLPDHEVCGFDNTERAIAAGKGTIAILGHLGNWELLSAVFGKRTGRLFVVAQPMSNTIVDKWLHEKRTSMSVTTIYASQALRKMMEALRGNNIIGILIDQAIKRHGTPAPFLGKEASTVRTAAGLAVKTGCTVLATYAVMRPDGSYHIEIDHVPCPDLGDCDGEEATSRLQHLHNDVISRYILEYPDHWFGWFHRRFRGFADYSR